MEVRAVGKSSCKADTGRVIWTAWGGRDWTCWASHVTCLRLRAGGGCSGPARVHVPRGADQQCLPYCQRLGRAGCLWRATSRAMASAASCTVMEALGPVTHADAQFGATALDPPQAEVAGLHRPVLVGTIRACRTTGGLAAWTSSCATCPRTLRTSTALEGTTGWGDRALLHLPRPQPSHCPVAVLWPRCGVRCLCSFCTQQKSEAHHHPDWLLHSLLGEGGAGGGARLLASPHTDPRHGHELPAGQVLACGASLQPRPGG